MDSNNHNRCFPGHQQEPQQRHTQKPENGNLWLGFTHWLPGTQHLQIPSSNSEKIPRLSCTCSFSQLLAPGSQFGDLHPENPGATVPALQPSLSPKKAIWFHLKCSPLVHSVWCGHFCFYCPKVEGRQRSAWMLIHNSKHTCFGAHWFLLSSAFFFSFFS